MAWREAHAEGGATSARDPAAGELLFLEGRRLMKEGDRRAACAKFAESERLDPAVGTLANLADCEEQIGRTASAWEHWRQAAGRMRPGDPRRTTAVARAAALEKRMARLSVNLAPGAPTDAVVRRNGVALGQASYGLHMPVDPGAHLVEVAAPGRQIQRRTVVIAPEERWELVLEVGPPDDSGATAIVPPPIVSSPFGVLPASARPTSLGSTDAVLGGRSSTEEASRRPRSRWMAWGLVAGGGAAVATGAALGWQALRMRQYAADRCATGARGDTPGCWATARRALELDRRFSVGADVAFATGAVAAGAGLFLLLRGDRTTVRAAPHRGGGEVQVAGAF